MSSAGDQLLSDWAKDGYDVVRRQARSQPQTAAVRDLLTGNSLTYDELDLAIARCTAWLEEKLPMRGARVALLARNSFQHMILFYACARSGAIFVPFNWRLTGHELKALVSDCGPEFLIFQSEFAEAAGVAASAATTCNALSSDEFQKAMDKYAPSATHSHEPGAVSMLLYTSGTTGKPKAVSLTARNCFFQSINFIAVGSVDSNSVMLLNVPLFHVVGLMAIMNSAFCAGGRVVMSDRFIATEALAQLSDPEIGITHYFCVPQIVQALVNDPEYAESDLTRLTGLFTGGAPMPPTLTRKLIADGIMAVNGYGLSECGTAIHMPLDSARTLEKLGAVGMPAPHIAVRLVGADGTDVSPGEIGEIWLKGPGVTKGYWNQPEINAQCFAEGWLKTGDAARQDSDGYYTIVDRWKDLYISGGENVYPAEIEAVLRELPGVLDAGVIGVTDEKWGESGCAYVVLKQNAQISHQEILAHCAPRLARYKQPAHIKFVDVIPRNAAGKILKDKLRQHFAAEHT
jgi:fatty-acyl-CoA synthase